MNQPVTREAIIDRVNAWTDRQIAAVVARQVQGIFTEAEVKWWECEISREAYRIQVCALEAAGLAITPESPIVALEA